VNNLGLVSILFNNFFNSIFNLFSVFSFKVQFIFQSEFDSIKVWSRLSIDFQSQRFHDRASCRFWDHPNEQGYLVCGVLGTSQGDHHPQVEPLLESYISYIKW
jgi:hypothetical protein